MSHVAKVNLVKLAMLLIDKGLITIEELTEYTDIDFIDTKKENLAAN